jgi:L-alanine-DL-glutamate epimerase-like enolase superfamily enzyme
VEFGRAVAALPNIAWVEEPVWPPEGFAAIAEVRRALGGAPRIAAGENCGSPEDIRRLSAAGAVDVAQPSITKLGGVSALREVMAMAAPGGGLRVVPHSPYFGPGLLATLHLLAAATAEEPLEYYYAELAMPPFPPLVPQGGFVTVPQGPGLGLEPALESAAG